MKIHVTVQKKQRTEKHSAKNLASLCDVFVNDAFGTAHRAHCSNVGVTKYVDTAVVGYLMQKEIDFLGNAVNNPVRPFVAILGGAKVADKFNVINNLLEKCDTLNHWWWYGIYIHQSSGWKSWYFISKMILS